MQLSWVLPPYIFILISILNTTYIILSIYYLRKFLQFKKIAFVSKRYPFISCIEVIGIISSIALNFTVITFYRCIDENTKLHQYLWNFTIFSQPITVYSYLYGLLWRCWHFYYDAKLNKQFESEWQTIITQKEPNNWHLNHKSTFGSPRFIAKRILFMYFLSCFISIFVWFMHHIIGYTFSLLIDFIVFLVPYILFFILYRRTPKTVNELHINDEMKRINIVIICSLIVYLAIIIIGGVISLRYQNIFAICMAFSSAFWTFLAAMIHTKWVLSHIGIWMQHSLDSLTKSSFNLNRKNDLDSSTYMLYTESNKLSSLLNQIRIRTYSDPLRSRKIRASSDSSEKDRSENSNPLHKRNIKEIFQNEQCFNGFAHHLNAEYSIECILSFIEIMQLQKYIQDNYSEHLTKLASDEIDIVIKNENEPEPEIMHCENGNEKLMMFEFRDYVPKSHIVYVDSQATCNLINIKQKAYYLYVKYINEDSEYEVNISYYLRSKFVNLMDDYDAWTNDNDMDLQKLVKMFNMVCVEMYQLLSFSLSRYKSLLKSQQMKFENKISEAHQIALDMIAE